MIQPSWTCDNELLYIDDRTDWWNLYHVTKLGDHVNVLPQEKECGGPQWIFGMSAYMVDPRGNGNVVTVFGKVNEPPRGKTNNVVSKQVRLNNPGCTITEDG